MANADNATALPRSIIAVNTAVPAFIGYTEKHSHSGLSLLQRPTLVGSLPDYEKKYGRPRSENVHVHLHDDNSLNGPVVVSHPSFRLYYAIQSYFANGGGNCYIVSAGTYKKASDDPQDRLAQMQNALHAVALVDEPTLLVFPDAALLMKHSLSVPGDPLLSKTTFYHQLFNEAIEQCSSLKDRFAILDVWHPFDGALKDTMNYISAFREGIKATDLSYGACYYPALRTTIAPYINEKQASSITISGGTSIPARLVLRKDDKSTNLTNSLYHINRSLYEKIKTVITENTVVLPASTFAAAAYYKVDNTQGVWKAPANIGLQSVKTILIDIDDRDQDLLTVKSVNAIRAFPGRGIMVWGARTLNGNSNEWRYVSVRRFFMMVQESITKNLTAFQFEPNDANTWQTVKKLVEDFLAQLWRVGALQGTKPEHAFYVKVGLGETMTMQDITDGRLIIEVGMAVVRPAEFINIRICIIMKV